MADTARHIAFTALMRVEQAQAYSNITLDHLLRTEKLSARDAGFAARLFYGVLENRLLLDYNIAVSASRPLPDIDLPIVVLLRLGLYQHYFCHTVTSAAAVNETVALCRAEGYAEACGFVNGVLRKAVRMEQPRLPDAKKGKNKHYAVRYSCPEPIVRLWRQSYGDELTIGLLKALAERPPLCVRVNTLKTTAEKLMRVLADDGVQAQPFAGLDNCLMLTHTGAVEELQAYRMGLFHVQDAASQLCCRMLEPQPGESVLDVCAAPGGKSFTCAQLMQNRGRLCSGDLYDARLRLVEQGAERLDISILQTQQGDAATAEFPFKADRVLCDVPCSGLGILRRKPELRYKPDLGLEALPPVQYAILCHAAEYVRSGGVLLYSTCTLHPAENQMQVRRFLREHPDFMPMPITLPQGFERGMEENENEWTLFPQLCGTDGFFISLMKRK